MKDFLKTHPGYGNHTGYMRTHGTSPEYQIGINNGGDASTDLSIFSRLKPLFNIIITRDLRNPEFQSLLLKHRDIIILHYVVTGWGGTPMEPYTPDVRGSFQLLQNLISKGFPVDQIVLRIDPIIPNEAGLKALDLVLQAYSRTNIKRVRYKYFLHTNELLQRQSWFQVCNFVKNPYYSEERNKVFYSAAAWHRKAVNEILKRYEWTFTYESCDRSDSQISEHALGCISMKDLRIMGIPNIDVLETLKDNHNCRCPVNKRELMPNRTTQCPLRCVHCMKKTLMI